METSERLASMAKLEHAVLALLPVSMRRPADLKILALKRLAFAPKLLGPIRIVGRTEMSPVWRDIVIALADVVPVVWEADARSVPDWLAGNITVERLSSSPVATKYFSCADGSHEALEAIRWARDLIATGQGKPEEVAICAAAPQAFDAQMAAFADNAALPTGRGILYETPASGLAVLVLKRLGMIRHLRT